MAAATATTVALKPSSVSSFSHPSSHSVLARCACLSLGMPVSRFPAISMSSRLRVKSAGGEETFLFRDPIGSFDDEETEEEKVEAKGEQVEEEVDKPIFVPPAVQFERIPYFDEGPEETEEEVAAAYEELYGPVYSAESVLGNDIFVMDSKTKKAASTSKPRDGLEERVIQVRRVNKVVKGGRQLNFRAIVVVGDRQCNVGVGVGKAKEVVTAVQKAVVNARRNLITVPLTKYSTFPHRANGKFGAASVMLRPASPGTGVIAGGSVRVVLEMAGVQNALGKQLGSKNALNNARATVVAVQQMRQFSDVSRERGIPMEELWK